MTKKAWWLEEREEAGRLAAAGRTQKWKDTDAQLALSFLFIQGPQPGEFYLPWTGRVFPSQLTQSGKFLTGMSMRIINTLK